MGEVQAGSSGPGSGIFGAGFVKSALSKMLIDTVFSISSNGIPTDLDDIFLLSTRDTGNIRLILRNADYKGQ